MLRQKKDSEAVVEDKRVHEGGHMAEGVLRKLVFGHLVWDIETTVVGCFGEPVCAGDGRTHEHDSCGKNVYGGTAIVSWRQVCCYVWFTSEQQAVLLSLLSPRLLVVALSAHSSNLNLKYTRRAHRSASREDRCTRS